MGWDVCHISQRWSRGNDEECKLFHDFSYTFPKRQVSQTTYLSSRVSLIWAWKCHTCIWMHTKWLIWWHSKMIPSGLKQDMFGQSPHHAYHCNLFGSLLLQLNPNCIYVGLLCSHRTHTLHAEFDVGVSHPGRCVLFGYFSFCTHFL